VEKQVTQLKQANAQSNVSLYQLSAALALVL
jgi:hypothetical protein